CTSIILYISYSLTLSYKSHLSKNLNKKKISKSHSSSRKFSITSYILLLSTIDKTFSEQNNMYSSSQSLSMHLSRSNNLSSIPLHLQSSNMRILPLVLPEVLLPLNNSDCFSDFKKML